jgi:uncharacterized repeat protein (TIGR03803 family)
VPLCPRSVRCPLNLCLLARGNLLGSGLAVYLIVVLPWWSTLRGDFDEAFQISKSLPTLGLAFAGAAFTFGLAVCAQALNVSFFADFNGTNGWEPYGSVTQAPDGNFYGTAAGGIYGGGNIFRMTPTGEIHSLYTFCSLPNCADGGFPQTAPILGADGNLYGVTYGGPGTFYRMTTASSRISSPSAALDAVAVPRIPTASSWPATAVFTARPTMAEREMSAPSSRHDLQDQRDRPVHAPILFLLGQELH